MTGATSQRASSSVVLVWPALGNMHPRHWPPPPTTPATADGTVFHQSRLCLCLLCLSILPLSCLSFSHPLCFSRDTSQASLQLQITTSSSLPLSPSSPVHMATKKNAGRPKAKLPVEQLAILGMSFIHIPILTPIPPSPFPSSHGLHSSASNPAPTLSSLRHGLVMPSPPGAGPGPHSTRRPC